MLIHSPAGFAYGDNVELHRVASDIERLRHQGAEIICAGSKQPMETVQSWLSRDTWFTAEQAQVFGLVDEVVTSPAPRPARQRKAATDSPAPMPRTEDEKIFADWLLAFGRVQVSDREKFIRSLNEWAVHNTFCGG